MRGLVTILLAVITAMFCFLVTYLPVIGDVNSAPNQHVTPHYISRSAEDTGSPNIVTGVMMVDTSFGPEYPVRTCYRPVTNTAKDTILEGWLKLPF